MANYILSIDQSTQGTKGMLFDAHFHLIARADRAHRQMVNEKGWVSHDLHEILQNTLAVCREVVDKAGIQKEDIAVMGISNQRETTAAWKKSTGEPVCPAIVWQCSRAKDLCEELVNHSKEAQAGEALSAGHTEEADSGADLEELVKAKTGIPLSPYFPAAKMAWILRNVPEAAALADGAGNRDNDLAFGTIDSWLIYSLCQGHPHKCDYSNAGRTQLFNLITLQWDETLCRIFGVPMDSLPEVCMSDSCFGYTDLDGFLDHPIPVHGVLGDSHGALLGHGGITPGALKATYGTGSSVMMHVGGQPVFSKNGLVSSLAWGLDGKVSYVLEGNLNYTGAVISWLKNDLGLIQEAQETEWLAREANQEDQTYFVPAFSGLGAPYWNSDATGMFTGITRSTGRKELVKAGVECIGYQITDLVLLMETESRIPVETVRVDGGPTGNAYLMQFQADISGKEILVPSIQEFSGLGAAIAAGCGFKLARYDEVLGETEHSGALQKYRKYWPQMEPARRKSLYRGWKKAVQRVLCE